MRVPSMISLQQTDPAETCPIPSEMVGNHKIDNILDSCFCSKKILKNKECMPRSPTAHSVVFTGNIKPFSDEIRKALVVLDAVPKCPGTSNECEIDLARIVVSFGNSAPVGIYPILNVKRTAPMSSTRIRFVPVAVTVTVFPDPNLPVRIDPVIPITRKNVHKCSPLAQSRTRSSFIRSQQAATYRDHR